MTTAILHDIAITRQVSIYLPGSVSRDGLYFVHDYGTSEHTVKTMLGIQGDGFFRAFKQAWLREMETAFIMWGYVPERHAKAYKYLLRGVGLVEILFRGFPYEGMEEKVWVCGRKIDNEGRPIGPKMLWDR